jgi:hypothetical protein
MFNEFEGNKDERQAKLDERLDMLKRARKAGFFDEEGTEKVEIIADGIGPDDGCPTCGKPSTAFIDGDCAKCNPIRTARNTYKCYKCKGSGDEIRYEEIVGRCRACDGTGRLSDMLQAIDMMCAHCDGFGHDVLGVTCGRCHGTGVSPDLEATQ